MHYYWANVKILTVPLIELLQTMFANIFNFFATQGIIKRDSFWIILANIYASGAISYDFTMFLITAYWEFWCGIYGLSSKVKMFSNQN